MSLMDPTNMAATQFTLAPKMPWLDTEVRQRETHVRYAMAALVLVLSAAILNSQPESLLTKKEAASLVQEYVGAKTTASRRLEIVTRLKAGDRKLAATPLKTATADEGQVGLAIALAKDLRLPGMFALARKYLEGDHEDTIIGYGLALSEPDAAETIWERWKTKDRTGTSWAIANRALLANAVPLKVILLVKDFIDLSKGDDPLRDPAAAVLRFQLGLGDTSIDKMSNDWKRILAAYEADAKPFALSGLDLLEAPPVLAGEVVKVGKNFRLKGGCVFKVMATDEWKKNAFAIVVRVRIVEECDFRIVLRSANDAWMARYQKTEWMVPSSAGDRVVPGSVGAWVTIRYDVSAEATDSAPGVEVRNNRQCKVTIGDKVMLENGRFGGAMDRLEIWLPAEEKGSGVAGGIELIAK